MQARLILFPRHALTVLYDAGNRLIEVSEPGGRSLAITYVDRKCTGVHEYTHLKDWKDRYGDDVCKGRPDGTTPVGGPGYDDFLKKSECDAFKAGKKCREQLLKECKSEADKKVIEAAIQRDEREIIKLGCS